MDHDSLNLDFARAQRCGFPEVVYAAGKTVDEVVAACQRLYDAHQLVLLTRCRPEQIAALSAAFPDGEVFERCGSFLRGAPTPTHDGVVVISAGTSDEGVAEEAVATLCARVLLISTWPIVALPVCTAYLPTATPLPRPR